MLLGVGEGENQLWLFVVSRNISFRHSRTIICQGVNKVFFFLISPFCGSIHMFQGSSMCRELTTPISTSNHSIKLFPRTSLVSWFENHSDLLRRHSHFHDVINDITWSFHSFDILWQSWENFGQDTRAISALATVCCFGDNLVHVEAKPKIWHKKTVYFRCSRIGASLDEK